MIRKIFTASFLILILSALIFHFELLTHLRTIYFISQELPENKNKPIDKLSPSNHELVYLDSKQGRVVVNQFTPTSLFSYSNSTSKPAIILAIGIRLQNEDIDRFLKVAQDFSKLGFIVVWPRSEKVLTGSSYTENPDIYITTYNYLKNLQNINPNKISIVGLSTGASIALTAAEDQSLKDLHAFIFFGGYYDIFDYVESIITKKYTYQGKEINWTPEAATIEYLEETLQKTNAENILFNIENKKYLNKEWIKLLPQNEIKKLEIINPSKKIANFKTPIFIIHDKNDTQIPYVESVKLYKAVNKNSNSFFILTDIFNHVSPKKNIKLNFQKSVEYYLYFYKIFKYLG